MKIKCTVSLVLTLMTFIAITNGQDKLSLGIKTGVQTDFFINFPVKSVKPSINLIPGIALKYFVKSFVFSIESELNTKRHITETQFTDNTGKAILTTNSTFRFTHLNFPIVGTYLLQNQKFKTGISIGIISGFIVDSKFINDNVPEGSSIEKESETSEVNSINIEGMGGFHFSYIITNRILLNIDLRYTRSFIPLFTDQRLSVFFQTSSIQFGVNYFIK